MVYKSSTGGSNGGGGVTTINGESGDISLTSTGGTVTITTPTGSSVNLEASGLSAIGPYSVLANNTASSAVPTGQQTLNLGLLGFTDTGIIESLVSSNVSYNQEIIQNTSNAAGASSNFVAANDQTTATTHYGEFGINSSGFTGTGSFNIPGATYLDATTGDLVLGTTTANAVHFVTNSSATDAGVISSAGGWTINNSLALNGPETVTSSTANASTVGPNGTTNPAFNIDASATNSATGLNIASAAAAGGVFVTTLSTGSAESLTISSKGTGSLILQANLSTTSRYNISTSTNTATNESHNFTFNNVNTASTLRYSVAASADTTLTAGVEAVHTYWNLGSNRNHGSNTAIALQRDYRITGTNHTFTTAGGVITDEAVLSLDPSTGTGANATTTNLHTIYLPSVALAGTKTNSYGLTINANTGATNNYATQLNGSISLGPANPGTSGQVLTSGGNNAVPTWSTPSTVPTIAATTNLLVGDGAGNAAAAGAGNITSSSANAFTVGQTGATNAAFSVDASIATSVTGINIASAAAGNGVFLTTTSTATNESIFISSKGAGSAFLEANSSSNSRITVSTAAVTYANFSHSFNTLNNATASTIRWGMVSAADTVLTAGVEAPMIYWNLGNNRNHTSNTLIALQRDFRITGSVHSFSTAGGVITDCAALSIDGPDSAGTNATFTNSHGIYIPSKAIAGTVTNAYGITVNASTGAVNNYAAQLNGPVITGPLTSTSINFGGSTLNNYVQSGSWTPATTTLTVIGTPTYTGNYTRIGNMVFCYLQVHSTTSTVSTGGTTFFTGIPFAPAFDSTCSAYNQGTGIGVSSPGGVLAASSRVLTPTWGAASDIVVTFTYLV